MNALTRLFTQFRTHRGGGGRRHSGMNAGGTGASARARTGDATLGRGVRSLLGRGR